MRSSESADAHDLLERALSSYRAGARTEAELFCRRALRQRPTCGRSLHLLGRISASRGDFAEARRLFDQSIACDSRLLDVRCDRAQASFDMGRPEDAVDELRQTIAIAPRFFRAYGQLSALYHLLERISDAAELYAAWARHDPGNPEVLHMLAATSGTSVRPRCAPAFVETHFDKLASVFDERLVGDLRYRGHRLVAAALLSALHKERRSADTVLDAGCGTGLCGSLLRPHCRRLVGVDLSEQMLNRARTRRAYDELIVSDICAFMNERSTEFSAIVSSDVFIYFGDLSEPLRGARTALESGGVLVFTGEALAANGTESYRLEPHGRYCHGAGYLRNSVAEAGLQLLNLAHQTLRIEHGREVRALIAVARKP